MHSHQLYLYGTTLGLFFKIQDTMSNGDSKPSGFGVYQIILSPFPGVVINW
jgi:hypothetical protein